MEITNLKVSDILSDATFNCRGAIAPIDVAELARDIDTHGLQQPIVVQPYDENPKYKYRIVCGHRRHKAFMVLRKETIPCIINSEITEAQALVMNLTENLHRRDLNVVQEANALDRLYKAGLSVQEVAQEIGKSYTWVSVRFMLLELPEPIKEAAAAGFINQNHIRGLHQMKDVQKQIEAAKQIKDAKIRGEKSPKIKRPTFKRKILKAKIRDRDDIFWMQDHIQQHIGNNFGTRCLAWAAGEISDYELFIDINEIAYKAGIKYQIPYNLGDIA